MAVGEGLDATIGCVEEQNGKNIEEENEMVEGIRVIMKVSKGNQSNLAQSLVFSIPKARKTIIC